MYRIELDHNKLTSLPDSIGNLGEYLEYIGLKDNRLTSLPESMNDLVNLEYISIDGNQIKDLPYNIKRVIDNIDHDESIESDFN